MRQDGDAADRFFDAVNSAAILRERNPGAFNLPGGAVLLDSSNLLDPVALTTTPTTNALAISSASFVQLANGDVLAFGGQKNSVPVVDAEVYRNATGLWTAVGSMHEVRQGSRVRWVQWDRKDQRGL